MHPPTGTIAPLVNGHLQAADASADATDEISEEELERWLECQERLAVRAELAAHGLL